jgi:hypothetical protein
MKKFKLHHPDPWFGIPVQCLPLDFNHSDYEPEAWWTLQDSIPQRTDFMFRVADYYACQYQPAAQLVRFVADQVSWSVDSGLTIIVDEKHFYVNTIIGDWFVEGIPLDQQAPESTGEVAREIFFAAWRMLGFEITIHATDPE